MMDVSTYALIQRAHTIRPLGPGPVPLLLEPETHLQGLGLTVCSVDNILNERVGIRSLGLSFSIRDILRLAAQSFGYALVTPAQICASAVETLQDAIVRAMRKLVTTATQAIPGFDCSKHDARSWQSWVSAISKNLRLEGSSNGLSISVDWQNLGLDFLQFIVCAALNSVTAFVGKIAADVVAVVQRIKERCQSCLSTASGTKISSASSALSSREPAPGSAQGGGTVAYGSGGSYIGSSTTSYLPVIVIGAVTALGGFWIWRRRKRR